MPRELPSRPMAAAVASAALALVLLAAPRLSAALPPAALTLTGEPGLQRPLQVAQPTGAQLLPRGPIRRGLSQMADPVDPPSPPAAPAPRADQPLRSKAMPGQDGWLVGMGLLSVGLILGYWLQQTLLTAAKPVSAAMQWAGTDPQHHKQPKQRPMAIFFQSGNRGAGSKGGGKGGGRRGGGVNIQALNDRTKRLNSLLKRVLSQVMREEVKDPRIALHTTVMDVEITNDLAHCKVWVSILGSNQERQNTLASLTACAPFLRSKIARSVRMRRHPVLYFKLDETYDRAMRIDQIFEHINAGSTTPPLVPDDRLGTADEARLELEEEEDDQFEFDDEEWGVDEGEEGEEWEKGKGKERLGQPSQPALR